MDRLWYDCETRSPVPIKHGVAKYATLAEVIMAQWAINDGPIFVCDLTDPFDMELKLPSLIQAVTECDEIWAHNAEFDSTLMDKADWWPLIPMEKWRCTMALARMHGLPGGLDKLCEVFKLPMDEAKDKRGYEYIRLFCIPRKDGTFNDRFSHPEEWEGFLGYGGKDIVSMRAIYRKTPKWNATPRMWSLWHLDQRMNRRGVAVDLKLAEGAVIETTKAKKRFASRTAELTWDPVEGVSEVEATTQRNRLLQYMEGYGVSLPDLTADTVERRLEDESLPEHIKELLRIRQQASKASTAKYKRALTQHVGGRLRNLLVFCGASRTGRWAGRTLQPQNLPRPKHKQWDIDGAIVAFREQAMDLYDPDQCLGLASSCLRGIIVSEPGRKLVVADLANIEGRFMAWIANEDWKLEAFARYDRGEGPDLYKVSYARSFNLADPNVIADKGDDRRQIGKVQELALQYYGGVGAFCAMAETYGLRLGALADAAWATIPKPVLASARLLYVKAIKRRRTYGLDERTYLVCQSLVLMWRAAHPAITTFWNDLDIAFKSAIRTEFKQFKAGRVVVDRIGNWVRIRLPSGRYLCYPGSRIGVDDNQIRFVGVNPYTRQWGRIGTYNGKLTENIVQAGSADILMDGLLGAEAEGYNPILSIHDEVMCEPKDDAAFDDEGLSRIMTTYSPWNEGMPLTAKGFSTHRYFKEQ